MGISDYFPGGRTSPSLSSETTTRADQVRTGAVAPTRAERKVCWAARDSYFECLDKHDIDDALRNEGKDATKACGPQSAQLEQKCAAQWVLYFKKWRMQDIQKQKRLKELEAQGAVRMDMSPDFSAKPS